MNKGTDLLYFDIITGWGRKWNNGTIRMTEHFHLTIATYQNNSERICTQCWWENKTKENVKMMSGVSLVKRLTYTNCNHVFYNDNNNKWKYYNIVYYSTWIILCYVNWSLFVQIIDFPSVNINGKKIKYPKKKQQKT